VEKEKVLAGGIRSLLGESLREGIRLGKIRRRINLSSNGGNKFRVFEFGVKK